MTFCGHAFQLSNESVIYLGEGGRDPSNACVECSALKYN